ncbi:mitoferrin-like [Hylaeus volcanicus]|uniref:mitoferrin-like n=1 Tax=Hylaeus volcanicus TaxID=313075 RepID=UPI0023B7ED9F|nr:mitoferrin-like [Hylaeus volcanicus]
MNMTAKKDSSSFMEQFEWESWKHDTPFWVHVIAGSSAGVAEHSFVYPLDTLKTRLQSVSVSTRNCSSQLKYWSFFDKKYIFRLFRGLPTLCIGCIPAHIALFSVYELSKSMLGTDTIIRSSLCGAFSTLAHDLILTPVDVIKQRLQLGYHKSALQCCHKLYIHGRLSSFYRSLGTILLMNVPFSAIFVTANEALRRFIWPSFTTKTSDTYFLNTHKLVYLHFFTAGIAGGLAGICTTPLDVIKTRLQTQSYSLNNLNKSYPTSSSVIHCESLKRLPTVPFVTRTFEESKEISFNKFFRKEPFFSFKNQRKPWTMPSSHFPSSVIHGNQGNVQTPRYTNFKTTAKLLFKEEGYKVFWRGAFLRLLFTAPSAAICWGTYENVKTYLHPVTNEYRY